MRSSTLGLALVLVGSLAAAGWATCVGGADMMARAQMACCKAGHDKCPMHGSAADCCRHEGQQSQAQVSVAAHSLASKLAPPALCDAILGAIQASIIERAQVSASAHAIVDAPSPPSYLLTSALLI